jgi:hypothetical protein
MHWQEIKHSSDISAVGYDPTTQKLQIIFKKGNQYEYDDVPSETHIQLITAHSAGKFFNANIKGKYKFRKL